LFVEECSLPTAIAVGNEHLTKKSGMSVLK